MSAPSVDRLPLAVLDGHLLGDDALARLLPECRSLTAFTTGADHGDLAARWAAVAPDAELIDGGRVADLREALVECAKRRIVVIATGEPSDPRRFVALALQGAAAMTEYEVPGVAVHVLRPQARRGTVAWLTETGELSGYGVLFAVGYAHLHGTGVDLIEPTGGLDLPRTEEALTDALAFADAAGVAITRHTDPSPFARVLRDPHCLVVHPVLDAPKGFNLLHPGELSGKAVASGNPAVIVELLEQFPGDVVAVFDGVHLLSGAIPAAKIAAGVALGVVAAAGIGAVAASPAMAAPASSSQHVVGNAVSVSGHVPGISWVATPHSHGQTTLSLHNDTDHDIAVNVVGGHGHGGGNAGSQTVVVPGHGYGSVTLGGGVKQWFLEPGAQLQQPVVTPQTTPDRTPDKTPEKTPDPVVVTGTVETFTDYGPVPQVVVQKPTTDTELETTEPIPQPPKLEVPPPEVTAIATPSFTGYGPVPTPGDLVPPKPGDQTPPVVPQGVPTPVDQKVPEPMLVPPKPGDQTPPQVPQGVPTPITNKGPEEPPLPPHEVVVTPIATPSFTGYGPVTTPDPQVVPPTQVVQQVTPPQGPTIPVTTASVPTPATTGTEPTTTPVVEPGSTETPTAGSTAEIPTVTTFVTPGTTSGAHAGHHTTHHQATHHRTDQQTATTGSPEELAHTGGNTAILAIVAGSLLAAGTGLAVASRVRKDDEPDA